MRSYLKRCESAISSISLSGKRSTKNMSSNSIRIKQSTSSWYIENIDGPGTENPNKHFSELDCIGNEMMSSAAEIAQQLENPTNNGNAECFDVHNPKNEFLKSTFQPVSMILKSKNFDVIKIKTKFYVCIVPLNCAVKWKQNRC